MNDINKKSVFYIKFDWMFSELNLSDTTCDVFALIFSFTRNNKLTYYGTVQYLADRINKSEKSVSRSLKYLVDVGYIEKFNINYNNLIRPAYRVNEQIANLHKDDLIMPDYICINDDQDKMSDTTEEITYDIADKMSIDTDKMSVYNKNNNINNNILSKSNELDLSKIFKHSEECVSISDITTSAVASVYENIELNENSPADETQSQAQDDIDKINALKLFKSNKSKNNKKESVFSKCAKLTNSKSQYSKNVKNLLYKYLQFRITRRGLTETVWSQILESLEEAISDAPTKDNDKLNYLREFVIKESLSCSYNKFYKINDRTLPRLLSEYNPSSRGINVDLDGIPRQKHGPIDTSKLATNPDGTPMIF